MEQKYIMLRAKSIAGAGLFVLALALAGAAEASAQSTLFNIPSTDVVAKKKVYAEFDFISHLEPHGHHIRVHLDLFPLEQIVSWILSYDDGSLKGRERAFDARMHAAYQELLRRYGDLGRGAVREKAVEDALDLLADALHP